MNPHDVVNEFLVVVVIHSFPLFDHSLVGSFDV